MPHEVPMEEVHEQIHHAAHGQGPSWIMGVALSTAFMATFAAVSALLSSECGNDSLKKHGAAFDQWSLYQAKGIKSSVLQNKIDILQALDKAPSKKDAEDVARYKTEQEGIKATAEGFTAESRDYGNCQHKFELAVTLFQIAIAIAAISALTKIKPFWFMSLLFGAIGIYFLSTGFLSMPKHESHSAGSEHTPAKHAPDTGHEKAPDVKPAH